MFPRLEKMDVVVLCGGLGKRLKAVTKDKPKALARIGERAFLDILIGNLLRYGFRHIILSVGHLKEEIKSHFRQKQEYDLDFSEEKTPLGTGGALKKARPLIRNSTFLVMNGDCFCDVDFKGLSDFHLANGALMTMVLAQSDSARDSGFVKLGDGSRVIEFKEKVPQADTKLVSAGIYLMQKEVFSMMPEKEAFSLEFDFFPKLTRDNYFAYVTGARMLDIGTPERYERASEFLKGKINE